jgi:uncharacterized protein (UPF0264 family)
MTRLLVSVRDAFEAQVALQLDVGLLDVKEPRHGSLGRAAPRVVQQVVEAARGLPRPTPVSMALGELVEWTEHSDLAAEIPPGVAYAKLGLAGFARVPDWHTHWAQALGRFPRDTGRVAVVYLDRETANSPPAAEIIRQASRHRCAAVLFDTYDKSQGDLWTHVAPARLARWLRLARSHDLLTVVGGSLRQGMVGSVLRLKPDYVAVRGGVCAGDRAESICPEQLSRFARACRDEWEAWK